VFKPRIDLRIQPAIRPSYAFSSLTVYDASLDIDVFVILWIEAVLRAPDPTARDVPAAKCLNHAPVVIHERNGSKLEAELSNFRQDGLDVIIELQRCGSSVADLAPRSKKIGRRRVL
jgi:hypothetical protein